MTVSEDQDDLDDIEEYVNFTVIKLSLNGVVSLNFLMINVCTAVKCMYCSSRCITVSISEECFCEHANNYKIHCFCFHSNLIQPPGMMLRPAVFDLRVFRAEDIPQSRFFKIMLFL